MDKKRKIGPCPDPPAPVGGASGFSRTYRLRVVTPLFGGGTEPGKNDPVTLIRGSSIRGQLRFWWRASRGAACENVTALRQWETGVFGSATVASPTQIHVRVVEIGRQEPWAAYRSNGKARRRKPLPDVRDRCFSLYALFPFKGESDKSGGKPSDPATPTWHAEFDLTVTCPDKAMLEHEVEPALWAWVNFGGLGARTRRGCGSLFCEQFSPPQGAAVHEWYASCLKRYGLELPEAPKPWPTLPKRVMFKADGTAQEPFEAWWQVVELLKRFRQGLGVGRDPIKPGSTVPGPSRWPEANSLRCLNNCALERPGTALKLGFPRAGFGLPIVFYFKAAKRRPEPAEMTLYPAEGKRMASPLILKALAMEGGRAVQVIVPLNVEPVRAVRLESKNVQVTAKLSQEQFGSDALLRPDLKGPDSPLRFSPKGSAVEAFLNFAQQEGGFR